MPDDVDECPNPAGDTVARLRLGGDPVPVRSGEAPASTRPVEEGRMERRCRGITLRVLTLGAAGALMGACSSIQPVIQPVNVAGGVFFNQPCPSVHAIFTVPQGKLLIIEDASARAVNAATASIPGNPGIVPGVPVTLSLRTNPTGTIPFGSADHIVVEGVGLPIGGGRTVTGYAAPGTEVLFLLGGCIVDVNTVVHFSGRLVDFP